MFEFKWRFHQNKRGRPKSPRRQLQEDLLQRVFQERISLACDPSASASGHPSREGFGGKENIGGPVPGLKVSIQHSIIRVAYLEMGSPRFYKAFLVLSTEPRAHVKSNFYTWSQQVVYRNTSLILGCWFIKTENSFFIATLSFDKVGIVGLSRHRILFIGNSVINGTGLYADNKVIS